MTSRNRDGATPTNASSQSVAATLLLIGAVVLGVYGISTASMPALIGSAVIGAAAMFLLPRNALPATALWVLVLFPGGYIESVPAIVGRYFTPAVLVVAIWMIRLALAQGMTLLLRMPIRGGLIAAPLLALLFVSAVFSIDAERTFAWLAVFVVCVVAPALLGQVSLDDVWPTVRRTFAAIGLFLGGLAAADYLLHFNPWMSIYDQQHFNFVWASGFRTSTSLGHPLTTALVAGVALVVCVFSASKAQHWPYWVCAVGAMVALVLTVSRGSVIAVGLAAFIGVLAAPPRTGNSTARGRGRLAPLLIASTVFAAIALSPLLSRRSASEEGNSSASYRSQILDTATGLIGAHPTLGFGPGTSALPFENSSADGLENSALQFIVSNGIPAFLIFVIGLVVVVTVAMRRSRAGVAAAIAAFSISATGFNVFDSNPAIFALIAPLIVCAVMPGPGRSDQAESSLEPPKKTEDQPTGDHLPTPGSQIKQ